MGDAIFKVPTPLMLDKIVSAMDGIYEDMAQLKDGDARGDVYEYLLSKLSTAGVNGQFRTPRHIIRMMVDMMQPKPDELVCDPACVLFGSSTAHRAIRKTLIEDNRLEAVVSMPSGVFKPYAGVSTAVLVFTKTGHGGTDDVWFYDMRADGFSLDDKRSPISDNDIPDIVARFHDRAGEKDRQPTDQSFLVPKQEIVDNGYDLSINKYKKTEYVPVEYPPTLEIVAELRALEKKIGAEMDELERLLGL